MPIDVIDFKAENAAETFAKGLKKTGFAVISNHKIPHSLIDTAYDQWFDFFNAEIKFDPKWAFDKKTHGGYIPLDLSETAKGNDIKDIKEFFHYYPWGSCPDHLKEITQTLYDELSGLAKTLLQWIENYLPDTIANNLSESLSRMITNSTTTLFRLLYYPALTGNEPIGAIRAAAHEDINLLTVLPSATAAGLQVLAKDGKWLDVPRENGWIVINAGDMLQECTDFYYPSTTHRVINPEGAAAREPRLSMPLFLHPRGDVKLSECHTADSCRRERFKELGLD